jgi:hypothetical protein
LTAFWDGIADRCEVREREKAMTLRSLLETSAILIALTTGLPPTSNAQTNEAAPTSEESRPRASIAIEADALAYALPGYSGIVNFSLRNGFQVAFGTGRYDVPGFLLKGDEHYDKVKWKATVASVQVFRAGYRVKGPMKSGPAVGVVVLNQNFRLGAERLTGETRFREVSTGVTGGYYIHIGRHFYIYPTGAFTHNSVYSGNTMLQGTNYKVAKWGPAGSVHIGWEFGL